VTTQEDIAVWIDEARRQDSTHMLVACDTWDHEDFPINIKRGQDPREAISTRIGEHNRLMEVYWVDPKEATYEDIAVQLGLSRSHTYSRDDIPEDARQRLRQWFRGERDTK
jgi:hypothetical protein